MQQDVLWQAVLGEIEVSVSRGNYLTWFKNTCLLEHEDDKVVIGVPNIFIKHQLDLKYSPLFVQILAKNGIKASQVEYRIAPQSTSNTHPHTKADSTKKAKETEQLTKGGDQSTQNVRRKNHTNDLSHSYRQGLNERYDFDNFIVGASNELAFSACLAVTQKPGKQYNPLFLYGGVGIGKTHLLQAAGNTIARRNPDAKILYVSMEQFIQEFVDALRLRKTPAFAKHYRSADVLIVDDVQFLAGKEKIKEEFFHTFNALYQANKQIIISSDKPPKEIPTLEDRLRSRFTGGMTIDMQTPDYETRCAIVQAKSNSHGIELDQSIVDYLSTNFQSNIRELEGALNQLLAWCEIRGLVPSLSIATSLLHINRNRPKHLSSRQVIEKTARHFQISVDDIVGPKRDKDIVVPRQVAMYLLREELKLSFPKIAKELGRKDHTTAIHSVDKILAGLKTDSDLRMAVSEIREQLYG